MKRLIESIIALMCVYGSITSEWVFKAVIVVTLVFIFLILVELRDRRSNG